MSASLQQIHSPSSYDGMTKTGEKDAAVANIAEVDRKHCSTSLHILVTIIRNDNKKWTSTKKNTKNLLIRFTLQALPRLENVSCDHF